LGKFLCFLFSGLGIVVGGYLFEAKHGSNHQFLEILACAAGWGWGTIIGLIAWQIHYSLTKKVGK
jgi:hypothetical protein